LASIVRWKTLLANVRFSLIFAAASNEPSFFPLNRPGVDTEFGMSGSWEINPVVVADVKPFVHLAFAHWCFIALVIILKKPLLA